MKNNRRQLYIIGCITVSLVKVFHFIIFFYNYKIFQWRIRSEIFIYRMSNICLNSNAFLYQIVSYFIIPHPVLHFASDRNMSVLSHIIIKINIFRSKLSREQGFLNVWVQQQGRKEATG